MEIQFSRPKLFPSVFLRAAVCGFLIAIITLFVAVLLILPHLNHQIAANLVMPLAANSLILANFGFFGMRYELLAQTAFNGFTIRGNGMLVPLTILFVEILLTVVFSKFCTRGQLFFRERLTLSTVIAATAMIVSTLLTIIFPLSAPGFSLTSGWYVAFAVGLIIIVFVSVFPVLGRFNSGWKVATRVGSSVLGFLSFLFGIAYVAWLTATTGQFIPSTIGNAGVWLLNTSLLAPVEISSSIESKPLSLFLQRFQVPTSFSVVNYPIIWMGVFLVLVVAILSGLMIALRRPRGMYWIITPVVFLAFGFLVQIAGTTVVMALIQRVMAYLGIQRRR